MFTIRHEWLIDEFPTIIGIQTANGKWKELSRLVKGGEDGLRALIEQRKAFGPSRSHVGQCQGIEETAFDVSATMGHQIGFQKAWLDLIPLVKGANGDLVFEQGSGFRRRETVWCWFALGA